MLQRVLAVAEPAISRALQSLDQKARLPDDQNNHDPEKAILTTLHALLKRRGAEALEVTFESKLTADLGLDSLELAELSAVLEDDLGSDPYSEGIVPETVRDLVRFYVN